MPGSHCCNSLISVEFVVACMHCILQPAPSMQDVGPNKTLISEESLYHNTSPLYVGEMKEDLVFAMFCHFRWKERENHVNHMLFP